MDDETIPGPKGQSVDARANEAADRERNNAVVFPASCSRRIQQQAGPTGVEQVGVVKDGGRRESENRRLGFNLPLFSTSPASLCLLELMFRVSLTQSHK